MSGIRLVPDREPGRLAAATGDRGCADISVQLE